MGNIHGYNQTYWTKSTELRTYNEKRKFSIHRNVGTQTKDKN